MIKAVIFDMDGTMGDTLPLVLRSFREAIEPYANRRVRDEEIIATFGTSEEGTIKALIPEHFEQGMKAYYRNYKTYHAEYSHPFDGITDILRYLKSRKVILGIVTGKGAVGADITLREYGYENLFDGIDTGVPEGSRKPEGLRTLLQQFGLEPQEAVYVGDIPSDITAARQVGVEIISAAWADTAETQTLKDMNPELTFESVAAFGDYLKSVI